MNSKVISIFVTITLVFMIGGVWLVSALSTKKPLMGEEIPNQGSVHITLGQEHPAYNSNPPTSGWHSGTGTAGSGIKDQPVPDELVLHSMEHGAAVIWYKDDLPERDVERIKKAYNSAFGKKIMLPRKNLDVSVALTSWGRLLKLQSVDEIKIKEFIETNNDRAPEKAMI
jgi:hypothetical protein